MTRYKDIIAKLREYEAKDLLPSELNRCFKNCASPIACKRGVYIMLDSGFTIDEVYQEKQLELFPNS